MLGSLSGMELVIILVIVMIFFGVGRLGEVGGALGKGIREFKRASNDEVVDASAEPAKIEDSAPAESSESSAS